MVPCLACQKSSSSPLNFLLNCISCANSWHHRCHSPPVSDDELVAIIKAYNKIKPNPGAKLIWKCGTCTKIKNADIQQNRQSIAFKKATARQFAPQKPIVIDDDDDDDEIIALDGPPEVPKRNETTKPEVVHSSNIQRTAQDTFPHSRSRSSNAASYDQIHPPGRTSGTKDKQIRIVDDPFLVPDFIPPPAKPPQTSSSTKISEFVDLTLSSDEGDGSDDALEYLTPAPTSKQAVEVVHEEVPILTSNQAPSPRDAHSTAQTSTLTNTSQPLNHLLTRWLNDRHTSVGVKPDIWARACLRRDQDAANRRSLGSKSAHPPSISPPSRRNFKALKLSETSLSCSQAKVFLSAEEWLHEKRASLLLE